MTTLLRFFLPVVFVLAALFNASAQCGLLLQGPAANDTLCDESLNDPLLWNQLPLWDPVNNLHDLAEGATDLSLRLRDTCGGLSISFRLRLDLNGDGNAETVLTDGNLLTAGRLLYNNANSPGFLSGDTLLFDGRPLPPAQKYRFALETHTSGDTLTARLRWVTESAPTTYWPVQLPLGAHRIEWLAVQNGDTSVYAGNFRIRDCKKPTVVCINGLSVNIMPTGMIGLWASDFLQYTEDNVTPSNQLEIAVIKSDESNGVYPTDPAGNPLISVTFDCMELGTQMIQLWSKDNAGNTAFCETFVIMQDPSGLCGHPITTVVCVKEHCFNKPMEEVSIELEGWHPALPPLTIFELTNAFGCADSPGFLPLGASISISPVKDDNPTNGVTTFDMVLIARHILGLEPLNSPYKQIAADVNKSNSITTFDIVEIRRLILGFYSEFPWNPSWRFIPKSYTFPNPNNPFSAPFPESIDTIIQSSTNLEFVGLKVGDVNCSATVNNIQSPAEARGSAWLQAPDLFLRAGETADVPMSALQDAEWVGLQWSFEVNPAVMQIETVLPGSLPGFEEETWSLQGDILNGSWFDVQPAAIQSGSPLFYLRVKALRDTRLSEALYVNRSRLRPEAYTAEGSGEDLQLQFYRSSDLSGAIRVGNAQPNPTAAGFRLPVWLETPADLHLQLFDLQGRRCWEMHTQSGPGMQQIQIPAEAMAKDGLYLWRLTDGKGSWSGRVSRLAN